MTNYNIPNMRAGVLFYSVPVIRVVNTQTVVNFHPVITGVETNAYATVVPAPLETINKAIVDYSLRYIETVCTFSIKIGDQLKYDDILWVAISLKAGADYGMFGATYEEVK